MKILFVVSNILLSEPLGVMQLAAICKRNGHDTKLTTLGEKTMLEVVRSFDPDVIAYSLMTADESLFIKTDNLLKAHLKKMGRPVFRIMGGPHPTYFPEILKKSGLDAICIGEGDNAIVRIVAGIQEGKKLLNIPNVLCKDHGPDDRIQKEIIDDLDCLPFVDRNILYEAAPYYKMVGLRSVIASRGCPYTCTYCYNHVYNKMFKECGPIIRRRSPQKVIEEIKYVISTCPPVKMIRFGDDTLTHKVDPWSEELLRRYKNEIGLPFYCLMRPNTLTEDTAKLLSDAGCISMSMSVETGDETVRNDILKRNLTDKVVIRSFEIAAKYGIRVYANVMLGIPGTNLEHDFYSFRFTKKLKSSAPSFGIFCPFPNTELTEYAIKNGMLSRDVSLATNFDSRSVLNCYTEREKDIQLSLSYLAPLFCSLPGYFTPLLYGLVKIRLTKLYWLISSIHEIFCVAFYIFPPLVVRNPISGLRIFMDWLYYKMAKDSQ